VFGDLHQQNIQVLLIWVSNIFHFRTVYHCNIDHDGIFISLQERCRRNNYINVRQIGLKYSVCGVVFSSWWLLVWHFPGFSIVAGTLPTTTEILNNKTILRARIKRAFYQASCHDLFEQKPDKQWRRC